MRTRALPIAIAAGILCSAAIAEIQPLDSLSTYVHPTLATVQPLSAMSRSISYSAGGFESFDDGPLAGQQNWAVDVLQSRYNVVSGIGINGSKGVHVDSGSAPNVVDWAYPTNIATTPGQDELIAISIAMTRSAASAVQRAPEFYGIDVFGTGVKRAFRFGMTKDSNNSLSLGVTTHYNPELGFDPSADLVNVILATGLDADTYYNFEARANYATKTFDILNNGNVLFAGMPFADPTVSNLTDADIAYSQGPFAGVDDNGANFDEFTVQTIPVPEPSSALIALGAFALAASRRRKL